MNQKNYYKQKAIVWFSWSFFLLISGFVFYFLHLCFSFWILLGLVLITLLLPLITKSLASRLSSPLLFLLIGLFITICFAFLPEIYDPIIRKTFLTETVAAIQPVTGSYDGGKSKELFWVIRITWLTFILFFLFPIAVMMPLHWYERGKKRKAGRKIPHSPKVSLILPAYNEEKFILKSIKQGLSQDYHGEMEIIIIDDGSTDRTFEIAKELATCHQNVKIYRHEKNMGKPAALNTGFQKATGEISIFSDTDSHLDSDLVSRIVPHFDDPRVGVVAGMIIIDNEINLLTKLQQIEYLYNQQIIRFCQATHKGVLICPGAATAVRTEIARKIPSTERTVTEDADFTFEIARHGWKVSQEPEAISRTDAPENWRALINQRKRWLYGVLQTIWLHKWAIFFKNTKIPNLWVWWAWIGYITCPITVLAVILMPLFLWFIGISYLIFLGYYSLLIGAIYVFSHWYGIKQYSHSNKTKLTFLLPVYMVYQYILNILLFYLVIVFVIRKGVTVRYGGRDIHAV